LSQELDSGQQSADDELSREMQLFPGRQVKLLGSLGSTAEHDVSTLRRISGNLGGVVNTKAEVVGTIAVAIEIRLIVQDPEKRMMLNVLVRGAARANRYTQRSLDGRR
jgi:hypothetical protein